VHRGAGAYICGEETGFWTRSRQARQPRLKPPFPANQGLYKGPTLINKRGDAGDGAAIIRGGGEEYASSVSRPRRAPSWCRSRHVKRPGNYEIELGMPAREIIYAFAADRRTAHGQVLVPGARPRRC